MVRKTERRRLTIKEKLRWPKISGNLGSRVKTPQESVEWASGKQLPLSFDQSTWCAYGTSQGLQQKGNDTPFLMSEAETLLLVGKRRRLGQIHQLLAICG